MSRYLPRLAMMTQLPTRTHADSVLFGSPDYAIFLQQAGIRVIKSFLVILLLLYPVHCFLSKSIKRDYCLFNVGAVRVLCAVVAQTTKGLYEHHDRRDA